MEKRPVFIDCDPGVDDAFALMLAASRPELDIKAVCPVAGNVGYAHTGQNALRLADLLGLDCRVGRGAEQPLMVPPQNAAGVHGADGMGGYALPAASRDFDDKYAWEVLWEEAQAAKGALEVVALGPLTNVAIALLRYPQLKSLIKKITLMGGSAHMGNSSAYAEFNIWADPHAADAVFASGVPLAMAGFDGCFSCALAPDEFRAIAAGCGRIKPLATTLAEGLIKVHLGFGLSGAVVFDLIAMACFIRPEMASYKHCRVDIETQSSLSCGQTVVDLYRLMGKAPNCEVLLKADGDIYRQLLHDMAAYFS